MFRRLDPSAATVRLRFEGAEILAVAGESVAVALLAAGVVSVRDTPACASPRGPFCLMGVCFDCLVEIDGVANRQACMTRVRDGMTIRRQNGARSPA